MLDKIDNKMIFSYKFDQELLTKSMLEFAYLLSVNLLWYIFNILLTFNTIFAQVEHDFHLKCTS